VSHRDSCPLFTSLGICPFGFKCRYLYSHARRLEEGEGFQGAGLELIVDLERAIQARRMVGLEPQSDEVLQELTYEQLLRWVTETRGESNVVTPEKQKELRSRKVGRFNKWPTKCQFMLLLCQQDYPLSIAYLDSIGESLDAHREKRAERKSEKGGKVRGRYAALETSVEVEIEDDGTQPSFSVDAITEEDENLVSSNATMTTASYASNDTYMIDDGSTADVPLRPSEKCRLDFEGKLYLAPLTTVGNLPFRRLCSRFGSDIHCGEMGLASEFLSGSTQEWSLVRRHPVEKIFGVQVCGSRPQVLVPTAEAIVKACPNIDFLDVNLGCPIGEFL
jgi:tRNA-dihydrouridine synthase 3